MSKRLALEPYDRYIPWRDGTNTETVLHELLNSLKDGEYVKATWVVDNHEITIKGPVMKVEDVFLRDRPIRWEDGSINPFLTSLEVVRDEETTATRDNVVALQALVDSLEDGWEVTAELHDENGTMTRTGSVVVDGAYKYVAGDERIPLRWSGGVLHHKLRSITVIRPVVYRWECEGGV